MNLFKSKLGISRIGTIIIVVVVIVIIAAGGAYAAISLMSHTSSTTTSTATSTNTSSVSLTSTSSSSSSGATPTTLTWETTNTIFYLDPAVADDLYDPLVNENIYESLVQYNGSSPTQLIPWLASNYTVSSNEIDWNFTLRSGITFADGEPLNASAVYFSYYRTLLFDSNTPTSEGTEFDYDMQQFLNTSLSDVLCCKQTYNAEYVHNVLAQNFVQITGPSTITLHLMHPGSSFPYVLADGTFGGIVAPMYVMEHDLALWNQSSTSYTLPYPNLSGNLSTMIQEYFLDQVATCNSGITPNGCGTTYLDAPSSGSYAGTGPYILKSASLSTNNIVLQANSNYWGGGYQYTGGKRITPAFSTVDINYVPQLSTREIDLQNAAKSGQAMVVDVPSSNLYDFANRTAWLNNNQLSSSVSGVSLYGPYYPLQEMGYTLDQNVTNSQTGTFYTFQPFADHRIRLAFADTVNMTLLNQQANNNLGIAANSWINPNIAPAGVYNSSIKTAYSYNLTGVQDLLLSAMENPITHFTFENGTVAPPGVFNNTFGCTTLNSNNQCSNPVPQTMNLQYISGNSFDGDVYNQIATAINNVSATYNMGLTVTVQPVPVGELLSTYVGPDADYSNDIGSYVVDYNYVTYLTNSIFSPTAEGFTGFSTSSLGPYYASLYNQSVVDAQTGNVSGLVRVVNLMVEMDNQAVSTLFGIYPANFYVTTSNIQGIQYFAPWNSIYYFATLS
jgi:ABC-type transport system substrate-binding protein